VQQRERATVHGAAGDQFVARVAQLHDHRCNGGHAAGRAVAGLGALQGRDLAAEHVDRRIEMPAVEVAAARFRAQMALEDLGHRARVDDRERGAGLDRHVDAAMLAELVAQIGEGADRIEPAHGDQA
jgi:hypothetical protein